MGRVEKEENKCIPSAVWKKKKNVIGIPVKGFEKTGVQNSLFIYKTENSLWRELFILKLE